MRQVFFKRSFFHVCGMERTPGYLAIYAVKKKRREDEMNNGAAGQAEERGCRAAATALHTVPLLYKAPAPR